MFKFLTVSWIYGPINRWVELGKATHEQQIVTVPLPVKPIGKAHQFMLKEKVEQVKENMVPFDST